MKHSKILTGVGLVLAMGGAGIAMAADRAIPDPTAPATQTVPDTHSEADQDADNTGRNTVDRDGHTLTPADQSNAPADVDLAQRIRSALTEDDSLSMDAKNIKVITTAGQVTLRGPVDSREEHDTILRHVKQAGATGTLNDQLEVKVSP